MSVPRGQFDFLRPNNNLFAYFTSLVESYSLVIDGPPAIENPNREKEDKGPDVDGDINEMTMGVTPR